MMNITANNVTHITDLGEIWGYLAFVGVLLVACIVCNGLILAVFALDHRIRNQTNNFVVSLACADIVLGMVSMPLWIANAAPHIKVTYYLTSVDLLCCSASIFSCALLSLERAFNIIYPFWYANTVTTDRVKIVIIIGWIAAILVGGLSLTRGKDANNIPYISFITLVIYVLPVLSIFISYLSIFFVARKHSHNIRRQSPRLAADSSSKPRSDAKTAWRLGIFIAVFIISWTPVFILIWFKAFMVGSMLPVAFHVLANSLPYLNAVINPFLYALGNSAFRKSMKKLYKRKMLSRNTKSSSNRRMQTSTFNTNLNHSPRLSRTLQTSPKTDRKSEISFLSLPQSESECEPLKYQSRRVTNICESSV